MKQFFRKKTEQKLPEVIAYESLWLQKKMSFAHIAGLRKEHPQMLLSEYISDTETLREQLYQATHQINSSLGIITQSSPEYPPGLKDTRDPVELLYYRGDIDYL